MTDVLFSLWHRLRYTRLRDALRGQLDASLDWQSLISLAELPPELAGAARQVVSRSRLWRREKVDVAAELIAHFQDGLAAGRTPAELLHSFGDREASAQLIRRAKRRGRPIVWHAWRYGWMSASAVLLLYVTAGLWMATSRPTIKTDYLAEFNKPVLAVPGDHRAWPLYRDALLGLGADRGKETISGSVLELVDAKPGDADWKKLEPLLKQHADSVAKLREAAARPNLGFVASTSHADFSAKDRELFGVTLTKQEIELSKSRTIEDRWLIATLLPDMLHLRDAGMLLAADAQRAAASGDGNTALADIRAMLGVSRHCEELPFIVCILVSDSVQDRARKTIQSVLSMNSKLWSNDQLRDLAHQLVASQIDWRRGFQGERTCFYDSMQRVYTDDGHGDGRLALNVSRDKNLFELIDSVSTDGAVSRSAFSNPVLALLSMPAANLAIAGRKEMTDMYDQVTNDALARLGAPYWTWSKQPSLDQEVQSLKKGPLHGFRHFFVLLLTPSHDTFLNHVIASDGNRDGVFIGLALELYHRDHNKWPESLTELSPKYLPTLPADPVTGKALHYKVVNDRPIVYSVGVDGDDDGGRLAKNKDGESHPEYAEPNHLGLGLRLGHEAVRESETDGDWVLWAPTAGK
jgi:hypothetical protein